MVEKLILDKNTIYKLTKRKAQKLLIQYNEKNKRAWFKTESMFKRKPIDITRVINL